MILNLFVSLQMVWLGRCLGCAEQFLVGELIVGLDRFIDGPAFFHPRCLICSQVKSQSAFRSCEEV